MMSAFFRFFSRRSRGSRGSAGRALNARLAFESLERREYLSAAALVAFPPTQALNLIAGPRQAIYSLNTNEKGADFVYSHHGGNAVGRQTSLTGGVAIEGGGKDVAQVYQWMGAKANGGDFLVLGTSGSDAYDSYIYGLNAKNPSQNPYGGVPLSSVSTLVISSNPSTDPTWTPAAISFVVSAINDASAIFIEGGDQSTYVNFWKGAGNPIETALQNAINNNVPIGGTSAGANILSQFIYTAATTSAVSSTALANPYDPSITLDSNFLSISALGNTIIDPHFYQRDRMGRLVTFMERLTNFDSIWATPGTPIKGIGVDEQTAILVDTMGINAGNATVVGNGAGDVYFLQSTGIAEICSPNMALEVTTNPITVHRATVGQTLNLNTIWNDTSAAYTDYQLTVSNRVLTSTQASGAIY
jgi:cyanophycinase